MHAKLTLRLDETLIAEAKEYSRRAGKPLSQLVAEFFSSLGPRPGTKENLDLPPRVRELYGCLAGANVDEEDYRRYLEEKYR